MPTIKLQSQDGRVFDVPLELARCSLTIKTMLEDLGMEEGEEEVIPLPTVTGDILEKVLAWADHHKDDTSTGGERESGDDVRGAVVQFSEWDAEFLRIDNDVLYALTRAANYLDVKGLLDLTCRAVASKIRGRSAQEIRTLFNLAV